MAGIHLQSRRVQRKPQKWVLWTGALALFFFTTWFSYGFFQAFQQGTLPSFGSLLPAWGKQHILVMGVDERAGDVGRSDTLFVVTIDSWTGTAAILSIPRDTRVEYPDGRGYDKVNHAYAYGGVKLTKRVVEKLLGTSMDDTVVINLHAFKKMVDAIGGIDLEIEHRMYYVDPYDDDGGLEINLRAGMQHLDGEKAMQYVRYRDEEGDIGRVKRQQRFMQAVAAQLTEPGVIAKLPAILKQAKQTVDTSLSAGELISLVPTVARAQSNGIRGAMVPGRPQMIGGISYWIPEKPAVIKEQVDKILSAKKI